MDLLQHLYIKLLLFFSVPIVLSAILRRIAGKHAPTHSVSDETDQTNSTWLSFDAGYDWDEDFYDPVIRRSLGYDE